MAKNRVIQWKPTYLVLLIMAPLSFALFKLRLAKLRLRSVSFSAAACRRIRNNVKE